MYERSRLPMYVMLLFSLAFLINSASAAVIGNTATQVGTFKVGEGLAGAVTNVTYNVNITNLISGTNTLTFSFVGASWCTVNTTSYANVANNTNRTFTAACRLGYGNTTNDTIIIQINQSHLQAGSTANFSTSFTTAPLQP